MFCMWISRDLDYERARNADLSASMNRPLPDPYRADQVGLDQVQSQGRPLGGFSLGCLVPRLSSCLDEELDERLAPRLFPGVLERWGTVEPLYCGHLGNLVRCPVYSGTPLLGRLGNLVKCHV